MLTPGECIAWAHLAVENDWLVFDDKRPGEYDYGPWSERPLTPDDIPLIVEKLGRIDNEAVDEEVRDDLEDYGIMEGGRYVDGWGVC